MEIMSDLQCPAVIVFSCPGGHPQDSIRELRALNVHNLYSDADTDAQAVAQVWGRALGLPVLTDPRLDGPIGAVDELVQDVADLARGETTLMLIAPALLSSTLVARCSNISARFADNHPLAPGASVAVSVDSAGWFCTRWDRVQP